jgi:hypothetical protein
LLPQRKNELPNAQLATACVVEALTEALRVRSQSIAIIALALNIFLTARAAAGSALIAFVIDILLKPPIVPILVLLEILRIGSSGDEGRRRKK